MDEPKQGLAIIAYGLPAQAAAERLRASLQSLGAFPCRFARAGGGSAFESRAAKIALLQDPPYEQTLYLDADTEVKALDFLAGFAFLEAGFDLVLAPSQNQGADFLTHAGAAERERTLRALGGQPLQLQAGVMFMRRSPALAALGRAWAEEWQAGGATYDQGALLRALWREPLRLWLLGRPFNGGEVIAHHFGRAHGRQQL